MTTDESVHALNGGAGNVAPTDSANPPDEKRQQDPISYWSALINEKVAGKFLGLTDRTMQGYRHRGGGPQYIRLSSRCLRYRRADLREWAEARMRTSTSDPGKGSA